MRAWNIISGAVQDIFNKTPEYEEEYYEDEYYDDEYEDEEPEPVEEPVVTKSTTRTPRSTRSTTRRATTARASKEPDISARLSEDRDYGRFSAQMMPTIAYPKSFADAVFIFEALNEGKITLVDVSGIVKGESKFDEAQRICDYLGGVCHALGLATTRINNTMYMITPYGCDVLNDLKSGSRSKVLDFFKTGTK